MDSMQITNNRPESADAPQTHLSNDRDYGRRSRERRQPPADTPRPIFEVHPVLILVVGTTMAEMLMLLDTIHPDKTTLGPHRSIVVDSLPYKDFVVRLTQSGYAEEHVRRVIPLGHYFHLRSPFTADFDFSHPRNREWLETLYDRDLQKVASKNDAPGAAKTPAFGKARAVASIPGLEKFIINHVQELIAIRQDTLGLKRGLIVLVFTTYRGGSGTGATPVASAALKKNLPDAKISLSVLMPCIFTSEEREKANAYAAVLENRYFHNFGQALPANDSYLPAPFDSVRYTFATNGRTALKPRDALVQEAQIAAAYLRPATQSSIAAREVDLGGVIPFDFNDEPTHCRQEWALAIETVQSEKYDYLAARWLRQEIEVRRVRLEDFLQGHTLSPEEEDKVRQLLALAVQEIGLEQDALLTRLAGNPSPAHTLRSFFENLRGTLACLGADEIKQQTLSVTERVNQSLPGLERQLNRQAGNLAAMLVRRIPEYVSAQRGVSPHLAIVLMQAIRHHLRTVAEYAQEAAQQQCQARDTYSQHLGQALHELREASPVVLFFRRNEIARDRAFATIDAALNHFVAYINQRLFEILNHTLNGKPNITGTNGQTGHLSTVTEALQEAEANLIGQIRDRFMSDLEQLDEHLDELGQRINKASPVFQRSLLLDGLRREDLDHEVDEIRRRHPTVSAITAFLEGTANVHQATNELKTLLPSFTDSVRRLGDIIQEDAGKSDIVIRLLKNSDPYTPIDETVERQQGLGSRDDNLRILELPGGPEGGLADLMLNQRVVENRTQIVDAGGDRIMLYFLRGGLPYYVVRPFLQEYRRAYDAYVAKPASISPHTTAHAHRLTGIAPPETNLAEHIQRLIFEVMAALDDRIRAMPSGGYTAHYDTEMTPEVSITEDKEFGQFENLVIWLAKETPIRKAYEQLLKETLDRDKDAYAESLTRAFLATTNPLARHHLRMSLLRFGIDAAKIKHTKEVKK